MEKIQKEPDFSSGKISKLIARFAIPCTVSLLVSALYNIVDQIFIGNGVGYLGNAATNVVCPVTFITLGFALWCGDGVAATYSLAMGKGEKESGHNIIGNGFVLVTILTAILTIIGFAAKKPLLYLFGATDVIYDYCDGYMTFIMIGIPFYMFINFLNPIIRADGSPRYALFAVLVGAILNIILDPIAIFVLHWGVKGAAIATTAGEVVSFILSILYFIKPKTFKLALNSFKLDGKLIKSILSLGLTSLLTQLAIMVIMSIMNNVLKRLGAQSEYGSEIPLSVIGIVMKVFQIVVSIVIGISIGSQPVVGFNCGAGNIKRVKEAYKVITLSTFIVCLVATIFFEAWPDGIIRIFGSEGELYNKYARLCFRIFLGSIILCGEVKATLVFLQAIGKPVESTILSLLRDLVLMISFTYILEAVGNVETVLWSAIISDVISFIITGIVIIRVLKKLDRTMSGQSLQNPDAQ